MNTSAFQTNKLSAPALAAYLAYDAAAGPRRGTRTQASLALELRKMPAKRRDGWEAAARTLLNGHTVTTAVDKNQPRKGNRTTMGTITPGNSPTSVRGSQTHLKDAVVATGLKPGENRADLPAVKIREKVGRRATSTLVPDMKPIKTKRAALPAAGIVQAAKVKRKTPKK